jgi:hypothetical protein
MTKNEAFRFLDLESYMVKPIQRLPKYVLLLKDLLKHTEEGHPDFANLTKAYQTYTKVTEENNEKLDRLLRNAKIFDLQRSYGGMVSFQLADSRREYLFEKLMQLFWKDKCKSVHVHFLSDLLLITERKTDSSPEANFDVVVSALRLNGSSQAKSIEDS